MSIVTIFLIGVAACVIFDLWQILFAKITGIPPSNWAITGRWCIGALTKRRFYAPNIEQIAPRPRELAVGWLLHYAVAISYAFIFWGLMSVSWLRAGFFDGLLFGVITVLVPWLFFLPCMGKGVMGRRTPNPLLISALSLMMHSLFGVSIGLGFLWSSI